MIGLGKLSPEARMVEVQCGSGLRARSLTDWLGPGAKYDGLDTDPALAQWCDAAYSRRLDFDFQSPLTLRSRSRCRSTTGARTSC